MPDISHTPHPTAGSDCGSAIEVKGNSLMPEAVIVAVSRSPIGRAFKGALKDTRPDQLAAWMVQAALDQVPELDPKTIDDVLLGCGMPGGEQGWNMARVVAVLLGLDNVPGATITRYCSSSVQTTRMAMHAIRAGEGDVFISAGVECVSRFGIGGSDTPPVSAADPKGQGANPYLDVQFDNAHARSMERAQHPVGVWHDPQGGRGTAGLLHQHGVDRGERRRVLQRVPRRSGRVRVAVARRWRPRRWRTGSGPRRSPRSPSPTAA